MIRITKLTKTERLKLSDVNHTYQLRIYANLIMSCCYLFFSANVYIKKLPENLSVVEGEKLRIHCNVLGTDPVVTWRVGKWTNTRAYCLCFSISQFLNFSFFYYCFECVAIEEYQENLQESDETPRGFDGMIYVPINDSRASYQDYENVKNATLVVNATALSDRGRYNCTATNMATESGIQKYKPVERGCYVRVKGKVAIENSI